MEITSACGKLNASQPLGGSRHRTCTKPYNVSQPLTRSPEKDSVSFSGANNTIKPVFKNSTNGLSPTELYNQGITAFRKGQKEFDNFLSKFPG